MEEQWRTVDGTTDRVVFPSFDSEGVSYKEQIYFLSPGWWKQTTDHWSIYCPSVVSSIEDVCLNKTFLIWIHFSLGFYFIKLGIKTSFWELAIISFCLVLAFGNFHGNFSKLLNSGFYLKIFVWNSSSNFWVYSSCLVSSRFLCLETLIVIFLTWVTKSTTRIVRTMRD